MEWHRSGTTRDKRGNHWDTAVPGNNNLVKKEIEKMQDVPRSSKRNWETIEIESESCASGGWGFGFHVTKLEGLLEETGKGKEQCKSLLSLD